MTPCLCTLAPCPYTLPSHTSLVPLHFEWLGHHKAACCKQTCLNFLHSEVVGTKNPSFQLPNTLLHLYPPTLTPSHSHIFPPSHPHAFVSLYPSTFLLMHPPPPPTLMLLQPHTLTLSNSCNLPPLCPMSHLLLPDIFRFWPICHIRQIS